MNVAAAKSIKEDIARATGYARRAEDIKALECASRAFEVFATTKTVVGRAKFELEILLGDMLRELDHLPEIRKRLDKPLAYKRGQEAFYAKALGAMARHVVQARDADAIQRESERRRHLDETLDKARQLLADKNLPVARRVLAVTCEQHAAIPGVYTAAAAILSEAGLHADAVPMAEKGIESDPKDAQAYRIATEACAVIGENAKAADLLREALRQFGAHPRTYITLARVLYKQGKWDQAYDAARAALDRDPELEDAREMVALTEKKVLG